MSNILEKFDHYLKADGPAAIVTREPLIPVEGPDGVLFPSTFASGDGFPGGYNIDGDPNGENIALVDSVGSQANRIEPLFAEPEQAALVPQVVTAPEMPSSAAHPCSRNFRTPSRHCWTEMPPT
jgi:CRISPR-associated protein Csb1